MRKVVGVILCTMILIVATNVSAKNWTMSPDSTVYFEDENVDVVVPNYSDFEHDKSDDGTNVTIIVPVEVSVDNPENHYNVRWVALIIYYFWDSNLNVWDDMGGDDTPFQNPSGSEPDNTGDLDPGDFSGSTSVTIDVTTSPPDGPGVPNPGPQIKFFVEVFGLIEGNPGDTETISDTFIVDIED